MDNLTPEQRKKNMRNIKEKNTRPEMIVRRHLFAKGFRYRVNYKGLPGSPDIYIPKYKTAIFVNGCFWHVHDCHLFVMPKTNQEFWKKKLERNVARDEENREDLNDLGIRVIVVWECGLRGDAVEDILEELVDMIKDDNDEMKLRKMSWDYDWDE